MLQKTAASNRYETQDAEDETDAAAKTTRRGSVRLFTHDGLGGVGILPGRPVGATGSRNHDAGAPCQRRTLYESAINGRVGLAALPRNAAGVGD